LKLAYSPLLRLLSADAYNARKPHRRTMPRSRSNANPIMSPFEQRTVLR
jgi:hypothetical protein